MTNFEKLTLLLTGVSLVLSGYAVSVSLSTDARLTYKDCRTELEEKNKKILEHLNQMVILTPACALRPRRYCENLKDEIWNMQFSLRSIRPLVKDNAVVKSLEELDLIGKRIDETISKFVGDARRDILIDIGQQMNKANTTLKSLDIVKIHCKE